MKAKYKNYLTLKQREYFARETKPRWHLDPPQRENYDTDAEYIKAMGDYADLAIKEEMLERLGKE